MRQQTLYGKFEISAQFQQISVLVQKSTNHEKYSIGDMIHQQILAAEIYATQCMPVKSPHQIGERLNNSTSRRLTSIFSAQFQLRKEN